MSESTSLPEQCPYVAVDPESRHLSVQHGPVPRADELLTKVHATGINRADLLQRKGLYPPPQDRSPIVGLKVAGTVQAEGANANNWQVGDRVCALTHGSSC